MYTNYTSPYQGIEQFKFNIKSKVSGLKNNIKPHTHARAYFYTTVAQNDKGRN